jgi:hypothetical protein
MLDVGIKILCYAILGEDFDTKLQIIGCFFSTNMRHLKLKQPYTSGGMQFDKALHGCDINAIFENRVRSTAIIRPQKLGLKLEAKFKTTPRTSPVLYILPYYSLLPNLKNII